MMAMPENTGTQNLGVLLVSGDRAARGTLRDFLHARQPELPTELYEAETAKRGLALLQRRPVDLVVVGPDVLRDAGGVIADVRAFDDKTEVIAIVDGADRGRAALADGAYDFFLEPIDLDRLDVVLRHVGAAAEARELGTLVTQRKGEPARLGPLVSRDPRMDALFAAARRLARYETPVLITGEPGTGKETLARAMHELTRGSRPFVAVQASATAPEEFTRAVAEAGNGTLYVDDVLALPPQAAAALLALLDGGVTGERATGVRVIAACPQGAARRRGEGTLQEDLYLRLSSTVLEIPPLRDRPDDILPIADHLLHELGAKAEEHGERVLSRGAAELLEHHDWPGNCDELRAVLDAARAVAADRPVEAGDLPGSIRNGHGAIDESATGESRRLADIEAAHLRKALTETRGNKARAARILGLSRWALQRKLQKHHISLRELS